MPHRIPTYRDPTRAKQKAHPFFASPRHKPAYSLKQQQYDRLKRNKESKRIYNTDAWKRARLMQLRSHPLCHDCLAVGRYTPATLVHHVDELTAAPDLALDPENFRSLCASCHSRLHATRPDPPLDANACTPGQA